MKIFDEIPYIESERIVVKKIEKSDAQGLSALINNENVYKYLPRYLREGAAELVHGIDDKRRSKIIDLATTDSIDTLSQVFLNDANVDSSRYAGGYMLLRYLAKQASISSSSVIPIVSFNASSLASSMSDTLSSAMTLASYEWSDNAIGTADTDNISEYFSGEGSMALFSSFDTAGSSFVTDSSIGVFKNLKKENISL